MSQTCPKPALSMSQTFPTHAPNMSNTCPINVPNHMSHCLEYAHHMSNRCPTYIQHMHSSCPKHVQHMSRTWPTYGHNTSRHVQHMAVTCPTHFQTVSYNEDITILYCSSPKNICESTGIPVGDLVRIISSYHRKSSGNSYFCIFFQLLNCSYASYNSISTFIQILVKLREYFPPTFQIL